MVIPLRGLVHKVDLLDFLHVDDGAGGITTTPDTSDLVYDGSRARVTVMSDKDEREGFGQASGKHWRVLLKYSPKLLEDKSYFLRLAASSRPAPIARTRSDSSIIYYVVIYVKHQIDHKGRFHHTTLAIELNDADG